MGVDFLHNLKHTLTHTVNTSQKSQDPKVKTPHQSAESDTGMNDAGVKLRSDFKIILFQLKPAEKLLADSFRDRG